MGALDEGIQCFLGFTMTDFKGRKDKKEESEDGPSPIPESLEESLPDNGQ